MGGSCGWWVWVVGVGGGYSLRLLFTPYPYIPVFNELVLVDLELVELELVELELV